MSTAIAPTRTRRLLPILWALLFAATVGCLSYAAGYWGAPAPAPSPAASTTPMAAPTGKPQWRTAAHDFAAAYMTPGSSPQRWADRLRPITSPNLVTTLAGQTIRQRPQALTLNTITTLRATPTKVVWIARYQASPTVLVGTSTRQPGGQWIITTADLGKQATRPTANPGKARATTPTGH